MSECAITSDVLEAEKENLPTIYPNPFNGEINIRFVESVRNGIIKIYNTHGNLLETKRIDHSQNILKLNSVSNFSNGMYFITILDSEGREIISEKFIKID